MLKTPRMTEILYVLYRWFTAAFFIYNLCRMFIDDPYYANQKIKWWIYFTNWGLILLNTRLLMGAFFLEEVFPILYAVLFNTSNALAIWISLVFWLVLYDPVRVGERIWQNHYEHTLNSVVVMADFFIERRKVFMADYWMPLGLSLSYGLILVPIFDLMKWKNVLGESRIYPIISWREIPRESVMVVAGLSACLVGIHGAFVAVSSALSF